MVVVLGIKKAVFLFPISIRCSFHLLDCVRISKQKQDSLAIAILSLGTSNASMLPYILAKTSSDSMFLTFLGPLFPSKIPTPLSALIELPSKINDSGPLEIPLKSS